MTKWQKLWQKVLNQAPNFDLIMETMKKEANLVGADKKEANLVGANKRRGK